MIRYQNRVAGEKEITSSSDEEGNNKEQGSSLEPITFHGMSALKSQWESGSINSAAKSENRVEEELAELRQKVKTSEPIKHAYERAVQEAKSLENISSKSEIVPDCSVKAVSIKEKFEKGKTEVEEDGIERLKKEREEEISRISVSETCTKEARNKFKQIEANMGKDQLQSNGHNNNGQIDDISISSNELQQRFKYFENLKENQSTHAKDEIDSNIDDIPKVDTTKKMLDKFKALEAGQTNGHIVNGVPKSPKRITPPRETANSVKQSYENEPSVERNPNIGM